MRIVYSNRRIERICTDAYTAERMYGRQMAYKIQQRIGELTAAESVEIMIQYRIGRCHPLVGDRKNEYAVDLVHPYRLVFEKQKTDILIVRVIEIVDYH